MRWISLAARSSPLYLCYCSSFGLLWLTFSFSVREKAEMSLFFEWRSAWAGCVSGGDVEAGLLVAVWLTFLRETGPNCILMAAASGDLAKIRASAATGAFELAAYVPTMPYCYRLARAP